MLQCTLASSLTLVGCQVPHFPVCLHQWKVLRLCWAAAAEKSCRGHTQWHPGPVLTHKHSAGSRASFTIKFRGSDGTNHNISPHVRSPIFLKCRRHNERNNFWLNRIIFVNSAAKRGSHEKLFLSTGVIYHDSTSSAVSRWCVVWAARIPLQSINSLY